MYLSDIFNSKKPVLGFELFPPKKEQAIESLYGQLWKFCHMKPDYFSITYGAGGGTKKHTVELAAKIRKEYGIESMVHLTCTGQNLDEINNILLKLKANRLVNILALRGDPPIDLPYPVRYLGCFNYASELISHIETHGTFFTAAAAYVEGHPDHPGIMAGLENLKQKVEAGAKMFVTQMFFDNNLFYNFREKYIAAGFKCPVTAGIMPVSNAYRLIKFATAGSCTLPAKLTHLFEKYADSPDDLLKAGIEYTSGQIEELLGNKVDGIHLFTMNRPGSTHEIISAAGLAK